MLEKLHAQPEHIKQRVILALTVAIFLVIVAVWASSFGARVEGKETREKTLSPLASVGEVFRGITSDVKAVFSSPASSTSADAKIASSTPKAPPRLDATVLEAVSVIETPEPKARAENFDISGIVIIDSKTATTSVKGKK